MDTAPKELIANQEKKSTLPTVAQQIINAEVMGESLLNKQRKPVLTFSQDALELSATSANMSSASPQVKKRFSISGVSSPLSGSAQSSPKSVRIQNVEDGTTATTFQKPSKK